MFQTNEDLYFFFYEIDKMRLYACEKNINKNVQGQSKRLSGEMMCIARVYISIKLSLASLFPG
jgi:hypothetical protein